MGTKKRALVGIAASVVLASAGSAAAVTPAAAAGTLHGCPRGWECLYKYDDYRGVHGTDKPDAEFYHYGLHRIYGFTSQSGSTVDNQYDSYPGEGVTCYYRNSSGTNFYAMDVGGDATPHFDLLPINSVRLVDLKGYANCPGDPS